MIPDPELRRLFQAESDEHLTHLDDRLLKLERTPADHTLLDEAFREAHSLKGAARMLGLDRVEAAAHALESLLNSARKGDTPLTPEAVARANEALAELRRHVRQALSSEAAPTPLATATATSSASSTAAAPGAPATSEAPAAPTEYREYRAPEAVAATTIARQAGIPSLTPTTGEPFRIETVRVETRKLDDLLTQVSELAVLRGRTQHRRALLDELLDQWSALSRARRRHPGAQRGVDSVEARDAEAPRRFGELLRQVREALLDDGSRLEATLSLLEEHVRGLRLLPLSTLFTLFPRMVRDLAAEQGKAVELRLEGGDITVDKRILEEMKDPIMHLLRNAVDHGVEPTDERKRLGKPTSATVSLRAAREDANVRLAVADDGRGLDLTAIRAEAAKRHLHDEATLAAMTPSQLQQLIFEAGFSTSALVTEVSGRGVGLDVVRTNVERMKGDIRIESRPGQGVTVQLRLPLRLATTRLLLASVGGGVYGLPVEFVHASRRVRDTDLFGIEGHPAVVADGEALPVARLAELLELPPEPEPEVHACVILGIGEERLGLLADELPGEEEIVPKALGPPLRRVRNVSALATLGSGQICPVLNPADLLRTARKARGAVRLDQAPAERETVRPAVLLAEDSALIRAMEKRILEDARYEVVTAVDGADAFNLLGSRAFVAVVSDILMPNVDGLALTARIRAEPRYKDLPVILVTSLASDDDKRRGLEAGANAYIPKPSFDQRMLLDTLKRLTVP